MACTLCNHHGADARPWWARREWVNALAFFGARVSRAKRDARMLPLGRLDADAHVTPLGLQDYSSLQQARATHLGRARRRLALRFASTDRLGRDSALSVQFQSSPTPLAW